MPKTTLALRLLHAALLVFCAVPAAAQDAAPPPHAVAKADHAAAAPSVAPTLEEAIARGVEIIVEMQEGDENAEWPYEGVYRVRRRIPIGYRVGGSAIASMALIDAPGWDEDEARRDAVARAVRFVIASIEHPLMSNDIDAKYDVRGWGYAYGLAILLRLEERGLIPLELVPDAKKAIRFFIAGIEATSIPRHGGWNYSRPGGFDAPARPSPFMTAPTLMALFSALERGYAVDESVITTGLTALERARTPTGSIVYGGVDGAKSRESVPGSVGRMLVTEIALELAGRSSAARIRAALDAFIVHWRWLDQRRAKNGTHVKPYGIAPYYFYYAHYYAARAVEMLPAHERDEYRRRIRELIFSVRLEDGRWNDRVFPRSANYGTAMAIMALMMPDLPAPARWKAEGAPK